MIIDLSVSPAYNTVEMHRFMNIGVLFTALVTERSYTRTGVSKFNARMFIQTQNTEKLIKASGFEKPLDTYVTLNLHYGTPSRNV